MMPQILKCTPCGDEIDLRKQDRAFVAFFEVGDGNGLRLATGCAHRAIPDIDKAFAVTFSDTCFQTVLNLWRERVLPHRRAN